MPTTLLIAEDEFFVRLTIAEYMRDQGYDVVEAGTADEALDIFRSGKPVDVLFTDVRMPGSMDGCDLAMHVRAEWPKTAVILTSGYSEALLTARSIAEDRILPKPYKPQDVLTTIRAITQANHRQA